MNRRIFLSMAGAAGATAILGRAQTIDGAAGIVQFNLEAKAGWMRFADHQAHLYAYNNQVPGPIIEARPGDTLRIGFTNSLPEATNLHFHGLHVSPSGAADNSLRMVASGEQFQYELPIPANHPGGMFWVHPHMHGTVARQVWRGLAAPLIIRGELDAIPEIQATPEVVLVLQDVTLGNNGEPVEPNFMEQIAGREGSLIGVSGTANPQIPITKDGWLRLRLINASCSRFYRLKLEEHVLNQISTDGGALPAPIGMDELLLVPGQRTDLMISGSRPPGSYRLLNLPYNRGAMGMGASFGGAAATTLATLTYQGQASQVFTLPQTLVPFQPLPSPATTRSFVLNSNMGMMSGRGTFGINGRAFDPGRIDTRVRLGDVEDWELINPMGMDHPMHIHTNPFQIVQPDGSVEPAWRDIVLVRAGGRIRVRMAFQDFPGVLVYHCHILDHEDLGMMGVLAINP